MSSPTLEATEIATPSFLALSPMSRALFFEDLKQDLIEHLRHKDSKETGPPPQSLRALTQPIAPRLLEEPGVGPLEQYHYYYGRKLFSKKRMGHFQSREACPEQKANFTPQDLELAENMQRQMSNDEAYYKIRFYDTDSVKSEHMATCYLDPLDIGDPAKAYPPRFNFGKLSTRHP